MVLRELKLCLESNQVNEADSEEPLSEAEIEERIQSALKSCSDSILKRAGGEIDTNEEVCSKSCIFPLQMHHTIVIL